MANAKKVRRVGSMVTGSKVMGSALHNALQTAAEKQIIAGGCRVGMGVVTFTGDTAYAQWKSREAQPDRWCYGRSLPTGNKVRNYKINYPSFGADAVFTRAEADLIAAYTLHETGHILYSNIDKVKVKARIREQGLKWPIIDDGEHNYSKLQPIWNGVEDARMENTVIVASVAAGARSLFSRLLDKITTDLPYSFNPTQPGAVPFTLAILCREALGNGNAFTAQLLNRIPEPKRSAYAFAMEEVKKLPVGYDKEAESWVVAAKFWEMFKDMNDEAKQNPPPPPPPPPPPEPCEDGEPSEDEDGQPGDDSEDGQPGQPGEDDDKSDMYEDGKEGGDDDQDEFEDKPTDEQPKGPAEESDEPGCQGMDDDKPGDEPKDEGDKPTDEQGGGDKGYEDKTDDGEEISAEPSVNDIFDRANERTKNKAPSSLRMFTACDIDISLAKRLITKTYKDRS